jgi:hypothetical protein
MGLKKIIKQLSAFLDDTDSDSVPLENRCVEIAELLEKLKKKQLKLEEKLKNTDKGSKRKSLKLDLKLTEAELKKGDQVFREKCSDLQKPEEPEPSPETMSTTNAESDLTDHNETNT